MSYLSPSVKNLLGLANSKDEKRCPGKLALESFEKNSEILRDYCVLDEVLIEDRDEAWYEKTVWKLAPFFQSCHEAYLKQSPAPPKQFFSWLSEPGLFESTLKLNGYKEKVLILTVLIETSLGNVFRTFHPGKSVPPLLKDLINSSELNETLGSDLFLLHHVFFGSPKSLNLRNLVWHGFASESDLSEALVSSLIILIQLTGKILLNKNVSILKAEYAPVQKCELNVLHFSDLVHLKEEEESVSSIWNASLKHKRSKNYLMSVCLLLPELESQLRTLFVKCNNCPERLLTAESTTLYTTFTEMFEQNLPDGSLNKLIGTLGIGATEYFFDMLILPKGPRLRDKICHGEVKLSQQDAGLESWIPALLVSLEALQELNHYGMTPGPCSSTIRKHSSLYHPTTLLKESLIKCMQLFQSLASIDLSMIIPNPQELSLSLDDKNIAGFKDSSEQDSVSYILGSLDHHRPNTLFRPKQEYSLLSALRRLSGELETLLKELNVYFRSKIPNIESLSNRQSNSLRKGVQTLPAIGGLISKIVAITYSNFMHLEEQSISSRANIQIKELKKLSNLISKVGANVRKSKWEEISETI